MHLKTLQLSRKTFRNVLEISFKDFDTVIQPIFVGNKIQQELKIKERKPSIVNQNCVVYKYQCDLCDASYVGFKNVERKLKQMVK